MEVSSEHDDSANLTSTWSVGLPVVIDYDVLMMIDEEWLGIEMSLVVVPVVVEK